MPRFDACPADSKKCVSTLNDSGYAALDPIAFSGDTEGAVEAIVAVVGSFPRTEVVERDSTYLRTEFTSLVFRFTDTVEFELDAEAGLIHFRSESVPFAGSDLGANRKRMKAVSEKLRARLG